MFLRNSDTHLPAYRGQTMRFEDICDSPQCQISHIYYDKNYGWRVVCYKCNKDYWTHFFSETIHKKKPVRLTYKLVYSARQGNNTHLEDSIFLK
jgi:hypothetical protein